MNEQGKHRWNDRVSQCLLTIASSESHKRREMSVSFIRDNQDFLATLLHSKDGSRLEDLHCWLNQGRLLFPVHRNMLKLIPQVCATSMQTSVK